MGTHSRGRRAARRPNEPWAPNTQDPLHGITDTNMPGLAGIRMARALQGQRGWRRVYAWSALVLLLLGPGWLFVLVVRRLLGG